MSARERARERAREEARERDREREQAAIVYSDDLTGVQAGHLRGFFEGWPSPPSPETHLRLLRASSHVVLALEHDSGRVVGFVTALSDGVLSAYLPLLEVLPTYRGRGIGTALVRRMLARLAGLYMVDVVCDPALVGFYARFGLRPATAASLRDHARQAGR